MTPARTVRRRAAATTLALALGLTVAGCGAGAPGVAATVNGTTISESAVDDVARDIHTLVESQPQAGVQVPSRADIVGQLVTRAVLLESLEGTGKIVSPSMVRQSVAQTVSDPSDALVEFLQVSAIGNNLTQAEIQSFTEQIQRADVDLNPRYGAFDAREGIIESTPNWMAAGSDAAGDGQD